MRIAPTRRRRRRWSSSASAERAGRRWRGAGQLGALLSQARGTTGLSRREQTGRSAVTVAAPDPREVREASLDELSRLRPAVAAGPVPARLGAGRPDRAAPDGGDRGADRGAAPDPGPLLRDAAAGGDELAARLAPGRHGHPAGVAVRDRRQGRPPVVRAAPRRALRAGLGARPEPSSSTRRCRSTSGWCERMPHIAERGDLRPAGGPGSSPRRSTRPTRRPCWTCTTAWTGRTWRRSAAAARCPGWSTRNAIGQRRWALEWAVILRGPYHDEPPGWEEVDLST